MIFSKIQSIAERETKLSSDSPVERKNFKYYKTPTFILILSWQHTQICIQKIKPRVYYVSLYCVNRQTSGALWCHPIPLCPRYRLALDHTALTARKPWSVVQDINTSYHIRSKIHLPNCLIIERHFTIKTSNIQIFSIFTTI